MARLDVPHHPDRVFKDDWWDGWKSASGYRALATDNDPLEAFAVVIDDESSFAEHQLTRQMNALQSPFVRVERFGRITIGFYAS